MRKDYQILIGQRFSVGGEIHVVQGMIEHDGHIYVQAVTSPEDDIVVSEPPAASAQESRLFELNEVIQSLLVDEEIVLFNPNYLAAR